MMVRGSVFIWIMALVCLICFPFVGMAVVHGPCANCHTMHNSQNGQAMTYDSSLIPRDMLLITACVACHTGTNVGATGVSPYNAPYVYDSAATPSYSPDGSTGDSLAGGNFYWVVNSGDRYGHNVNPLVGVDADMGLTPPGVGATNPLSGATHLECAGVYGCHGNRSAGQTNPMVAMYKSHHHNDYTTWKDGSTLAGSYRFLSGIQGFGDTKYEYRPNIVTPQHNKYFGIDRAYETEAADTLPNGGTISSFCAVCHQDFHNGTNKLLPSGSTTIAATYPGVWIRHPTDYDMSNVASSTEYTYYNGGTGTNNPYSLVAPLATNDKTTAVQKTAYTTTDDAILMCLSCHRAHGSPYPAMLRWNYRKWPDMTLPNPGYDGCSICHTTKD